MKKNQKLTAGEIIDLLNEEDYTDFQMGAIIDIITVKWAKDKKSKLLLQVIRATTLKLEAIHNQ
jgi:hypothetical protein